MTNTVTVADAARTLGISRQTVRRLIRAGHLDGHRLTPAPQSPYRVDKTSLDRYIQDHKPTT